MSVPEEKITRLRRFFFNSVVLVGTGTRVEPDTVVAKGILPLPRQFFLSAFRALPENFAEGYEVEWLAERGDAVEYNQPLARFTTEDAAGIPDVREFKSPIRGAIEEIRRDTGHVLMREHLDTRERHADVPVGSRIGLTGRRLKKCLKCEKGDFVEKGQVLAHRPDVASDSNAALVEFIISPISGTITSIDLKTGGLRIERKFTEFELHAGFFGTVTAVGSDYLEITGMGRRVHGLWGIGGESFGRLRVAVGSPEDELTEADISEDDKGAVLAGGAFIGLRALEKAASAGVKGIITGGADHLDLCRFADKEFEIAVTGREKVPFPLIITRGFGKDPDGFPMDAGLMEFLHENEGRWVFINGTTHIRAGVVRPEIVVLSETGATS